jgi:hypothetical protein
MRLLLLLLVVVTPIWALDVNEELPNVRVLAVHPGNIVVLNRGVEDGVVVGSHARLRGTAGHAARALCVKTGLMTSHWRLYRVVDGSAVTKDVPYALIGMDASEVPRSVDTVRYKDLTDKMPAFDEKILDGAPAPLDSDMTESLEKDAKFRESEKGMRKVLRANLDRERFKSDLSQARASLYASPWSMQKGPTNVDSVRVGARLDNQGVKYRYEAGVDHTAFRVSNEKNDVPRDDDVTTRRTEAFGTLTLRNLTPAWDAYSDLSWRQARYGSEAAPNGQFLIAPVGFTWRAAEGKIRRRFELSYAPTYDTRSHDGQRADGTRFSASDDGLRHAFRWLSVWQVNEGFSLTNDLRWRPKQDMSDWAIDTGDHLMQEKFTASWRLAGPLHADYEFQWMDDAQMRRLSSLPRVITVNSLNVRWDFEI